MKMRILLFMVGAIVKELLTAWFLFSRGMFHLSHPANIAVAVGAAILMAALIVGLVRVSSAAHSDPDSAWSGLVLFAVALVLVQPLAGSPALALVLVVGWVTVNERRREREHAEAQRRGMPTVPSGHVDAAQRRYRQYDDRGPRRQQVGPDRRGLLADGPKAGRRTGRGLSAVDAVDSFYRNT